MITKYKIKITPITKARHVKYACPNDGCDDVLMSPLENAGQQDACPTCRTSYVVPGKKELLAFQEETRLLETQKRKDGEVARIQREKRGTLQFRGIAVLAEWI